MRNTLRFGFVALTLVLLAACSQVQPSTPEALGTSALNQRYSFNSASAYFSDWDECSYSSVDVYASKGMSKSGPGSGSRESWMYVDIYRYDFCTDSYSYASGHTTLANNAFKVSGNLKSATLKTSVAVYDYSSDETFTVRVNLAWKGAGDLWQEKNRYQERYPNYRSNSRWQWSNRSTEVSGSVSRGTTNLLQGLSGNGYLSKTRSHTVTIDRRGPIIEWFDVWPQTIYEGQSAYLSWWVTAPDGTRLSIDQGIGDVTGQEWIAVSPEVTTTYTLTATNKRQSSTAQVTVFVMPRPEPDQYEPNDIPSMAKLITLDFSSPELNIVPSDVDWFRFTLTTAATVVADIDAWSLGSSLDSVMGLFDSSLGEIAISDDDDGLDPYLEQSLAPGTYYLAVSGFPDFDFSGDHSRIGFYYLSVTTTPPAP
ncbi:MAG: PPC domain-containing protein [Deinococcota bacterium]|nr:PPC domain-containing protein [Deinococcota bacterium]